MCEKTLKVINNEKTTLIWKITMTTEKPKNGLHTEYYDKGQMKLEENYKDGELID